MVLRSCFTILPYRFFIFLVFRLEQMMLLPPISRAVFTMLLVSMVLLSICFSLLFTTLLIRSRKQTATKNQNSEKSTTGEEAVSSSLPYIHRSVSRCRAPFCSMLLQMLSRASMSCLSRLTNSIFPAGTSIGLMSTWSSMPYFLI